MRAQVSAVIVNYRSYPEVHRCLEALRASDAPIETIVIDHAPDPVALGALRAAHPEVGIVDVDHNAGFGAGVNRGVRRASGDYLLVLNPDTIVEAATAACLAAWLDTHPTTGIVAPLVRTASGEIEASARAFPGWSTVLGGRSTVLSRLWPDNPLSRRNLLTGPHVERPRLVDWVSGACLLVRRETFERVGGFDEGFFLYWEDADFCRRVAAAGWGVVYHPGCRVTHLGSRSARHRPMASAVAFHRSVFRYFLKHGGRGRYVLAPAVYAGIQARLALALARTWWQSRRASRARA